MLSSALSFGLLLVSSVNTLPTGSSKSQLNARNSALDAASAAQDATTYLVCKLSYQTKSAAFALGIGPAAVPCISSPTSVPSITPIVVAAPVLGVTAPSVVVKPVDIKPTTTLSATTSTNTPCSETGPSSCLIQEQALKGHNDARKVHHAKDLEWDDGLAATALVWANNCEWKHSGQTLLSYPYGENLYSSTMNFPERTMNDAMYAFTSEEQYYDYSKPGFTESSGHFTQVVWRNTGKLGCAVVNCPLAYFETVSKTSSFFVCLYSGDAGNWRGQFAENVLAP